MLDCASNCSSNRAAVTGVGLVGKSCFSKWTMMYLAGVINASDAAVVWVVMPLMIVSCVIQAVMTWLPNAEIKLMSMALIATNPRSVRIQIEEFKVYVQSYPHSHYNIWRLFSAISWFILWHFCRITDCWWFLITVLKKWQWCCTL